MTEVVNAKVEAALPTPPTERLVALISKGADAIDEVEELITGMTKESVGWLKLDDPKVDWGAGAVRDWWLDRVEKAYGEEEMGHLRQRWTKAFDKAKEERVAKSGFAENLNAAIAKQARPKVEPEPKQEEAKEEAAPEPKAKSKAPHVEFAHDPPPEYPDTEPPVLSLAAPFDNAREFARRLCWKAGSLAVYAWGKGFWEWNGIAYVAMPEADLKAKVYQFLDRSVVRTADDRKARFRPKPKHVNELLDGLRAGLALPSWCEPPMRLDTGERAGGVLMFRNGLVEVANGGRVEPTPKLWVHDDVGYEWRPEAECPEWLRFLEGIFPGDQEAKDCLEEFLGLSMTEDVSFQKGLMEIGVPRSGKGTSMRVAEWLGGTKSFISLDLDKWMVGEFSGEGMIGNGLHPVWLTPA